MKFSLSELPRYIINFFLFLWVLFTITMFGWLILTSFKSTREIYQGVFAFPNEFLIDNYIRVLTDFAMLRYMFNSLVAVLTATVVVLVIATPVAYVLGKLKFFGQGPVSFSIIIGLGIPLQAIFIPLYLMMARAGFTDSLMGLSWLYAITSFPFTVYLLIGFFKTIPSTLEDAARVDGATAFQSFIKIMVPLARPGIISAGIFVFVMLWKEFLLSLVFISESSIQPISLGLYSLITRLTYTGDWGGLFAGVVLVMLPSIVFYSILAKRFIAGLTVGIGKS